MSPFSLNGELDCAAFFDPCADFDLLLKMLPPRWVVCAFIDADDRPLQLLSVKNLRQCVRRRLGVNTDEMPTHSRRIDYRGVVRKISWRRVDSLLEADLIYLEAARAVFPLTYRGMIGFTAAWFIHINPDANFPRYVKTTDLSIRTGQLLGPLENKHAAGKLIEEAVDWFDLCRYYSILVQAPAGQACAYKQMGKCPAPCDGSISMPQYRRLVEWSAQTLTDPRPLIDGSLQRMRAAAAELAFESARKIKQYADSLGVLGRGAFRHVRRLRDFRFLSLQRGPQPGQVKVFFITPDAVEYVCCLLAPPEQSAGWLEAALQPRQFIDQVDEIGAERIGVVSGRLFSAKSSHGVFLHVDQIDERRIQQAYRDTLKQVSEEAGPDVEGVLKELQQL